MSRPLLLDLFCGAGGAGVGYYRAGFEVISVDSAAWNGLFGKGRSDYKASGLTQRQYTYTVALPRYLEKFHSALLDPKQLRMF